MIDEAQPPATIGKKYHYEKTIYNERIRLKPHEHKCHTNASALAGVTIRTRGQVAKMLGISRQAVHQTERIALYKVRMRLAELLREDSEQDPFIASLIQKTICTMKKPRQQF